MPGTYLTKDGLAKLQLQLKDLHAQKRKLSKEVGVARELGDLRENAEYHAAKERLQQVVERINDLEFKLANVQMMDSSQFVDGLATLGTRVKVKDLKSGSEEVYTLVGPDESDPVAGKISIQSPLGKAFLGHKVKEEVTANLPGGAFKFRIISVEPME